MEYSYIITEPDLEKYDSLPEKKEGEDEDITDYKKELYFGKLSYYNIILSKNLTDNCKDINCHLCLKESNTFCIICKYNFTYNSFYHKKECLENFNDNIQIEEEQEEEKKEEEEGQEEETKEEEEKNNDFEENEEEKNNDFGDNEEINKSEEEIVENIENSNELIKGKNDSGKETLISVEKENKIEKISIKTEESDLENEIINLITNKDQLKNGLPKI